MTEEMFNLFEAHSDGTLSPKEESYLEKKISEFDEWKDAFEKYKQVNGVLENAVEEDIKERFKKIDKDRSGNAGYNKYWILASIIAAILIIGFSIGKLTTDSKVDSEMIAQNYTVGNTEVITRGNEIDKGDSLLEQQYKVHIDEANELIEKEEYESARNALEKISLDAPLAAQNKQWMIALTLYLENGRKDEEFQRILNEILDNPKHNCYNLAVDLDSKVNSFWGRLKD